MFTMSKLLISHSTELNVICFSSPYSTVKNLVLAVLRAVLRSGQVRVQIHDSSGDIVPVHSR